MLVGYRMLAQTSDAQDNPALKTLSKGNTDSFAWIYDRRLSVWFVHPYLGL